MEFEKLRQLAIDVQRRYQIQNSDSGLRIWTTAEYMQGFVGDVGSLSKLVMATNGYRDAENVRESIEHELADCFGQSWF